MRRFNQVKSVVTTMLTLLIWSVSTVSFASESRMEEIVVTAQKKESSLQTTPIAITAITAENIAERRIDSLRDVQHIAPSLVFSQINSGVMMAVRGVGTDINTFSTEGGVSLFIDGVYQARTHIQNSAFFDLDRIEVLRGPQGTLYGRNSTGGSVNIITKMPSFTPEAKISQTFGEFGLKETHLSGSMPLSDDTLAIRGSFSYVENDGWIDNKTLDKDVGGEEDISGRISLLWTPTDNFEMVVRGSWAENDSDGPILIYTREELVAPTLTSPGNPGGVLVLPQAALGGASFQQVFGLTLPAPGTVNFDRDTTFQNRPTENRFEYRSLSNTIKWEVSPSLTLTSITAYVESDSKRNDDLDGSDIDFFKSDIRRVSEQFTQEFNLSGRAFDEKLDWIVGAFYMSEDADQRQEFVFPSQQPFFEALLGIFSIGGPLPSGSLAAFGTHLDGVTTDARPFVDFDMILETTSIAGYMQGTWHFSDRVRGTAGVRYTRDERDATISAAANISGNVCTNRKNNGEWSDTTYRFTLDWDVSDNTFAYLTHSKGFKAGGYNSGLCDNEFDPENILATEVGLKTRIQEKVQLNAAAFYYDYEDLQTRQIINNASIVGNAAKAEIYGLELEATAYLLDNLTIDAAVTFLHAENEEYSVSDPMAPALGIQDLKGKELVRAPDWRATAGIEYNFDLGDSGGLLVRYEVTRSDNLFYTVFNNDFSEQEAYGVSNLRLTWRADQEAKGLEVQAFVENLTDEEYTEGHLASSFYGGVVSHFGTPRWVGVAASYTW